MAICADSTTGAVLASSSSLGLDAENNNINRSNRRRARAAQGLVAAQRYLRKLSSWGSLRSATAFFHQGRRVIHHHHDAPLVVALCSSSSSSSSSPGGKFRVVDVGHMRWQAVRLRRLIAADLLRLHGAGQGGWPLSSLSARLETPALPGNWAAAGASHSASPFFDRDWLSPPSGGGGYMATPLSNDAGSSRTSSRSNSSNSSSSSSSSGSSRSSRSSSGASSSWEERCVEQLRRGDPVPYSLRCKAWPLLARRMERRMARRALGFFDDFDDNTGEEKNDGNHHHNRADGHNDGDGDREGGYGGGRGGRGEVDQSRALSPKQWVPTTPLHETPLAPSSVSSSSSSSSSLSRMSRHLSPGTAYTPPAAVAPVMLPSRSVVS